MLKEPPLDIHSFTLTVEVKPPPPIFSPSPSTSPATATQQHSSNSNDFTVGKYEDVIMTESDTFMSHREHDYYSFCC